MTKQEFIEQYGMDSNPTGDACMLSDLNQLIQDEIERKVNELELNFKVTLLETGINDQSLIYKTSENTFEYCKSKLLKL